MSVTAGRPSVNVPVLSIMRLLLCPRISSDLASLNKAPSRAARPTPTTIDIGVARPIAHGHAITKTETLEMIACANRG